MSIYFARRHSDGAIKIGCSSCPEYRLKQLAIDFKTPVDLLAEAAGSFFAERWLHRQFAEHRLDDATRKPGQKEWYRPVETLVALVEVVRSTGSLPPPPDDDREVVMARRYNGGETLRQIGESYGITRERVRQLLRAQGVPSLGWRPPSEKSRQKAAA